MVKPIFSRGVLKKKGKADMAENQALNKAVGEKNDEFYTQLADIEAELRDYKKNFKGRIVFCDCDDSYESHLFTRSANEKHNK